MTRSVVDSRDTVRNEFVPNPNSKQPAVFASSCYVRAYLREMNGSLVPLLFTPKMVGQARENSKKNKEDVVPLASKWQRIWDIIVE